MESLKFYLKVYESNAFEGAEDEGEDDDGKRVLGHIPVGDGMVGTITLLDPQQQEVQQLVETKQKKRKSRIPYQSQFAHLTHVITFINISLIQVFPMQFKF